MLKKYIVQFSCQGGPQIEVEADDEGKAKELAWDKLSEMEPKDIMAELADIIVDDIGEADEDGGMKKWKQN
jgi:hypothetical protein